MDPRIPRHVGDNWRDTFDDELRYDDDIEELSFKNVVLLLDDEKDFYQDEAEGILDEEE